MFDYRELLVKYMTHVGSIDGINFLHDDLYDSDLFSEVEWETLKLLERESADV